MIHADPDDRSAGPPRVEATTKDDAVPAPSLPAGLSETLAGYRWAGDTVGESEGTVYRLTGKPGSPDLFVKHGTGRAADDVTDEMARLLWLSDRLPVPDVSAFVRTSKDAWLVTRALPGETARDRLASTRARARRSSMLWLHCFARSTPCGWTTAPSTRVWA